MRTGAILLRLAHLVGRQWRAQLAALAGLAAATAALLALPGQVAALTDGLHAGAAIAPVQRAALAACGLVVVYACALAVRVNFASRVGEMMAADLRAAAHARLLAVAPSWFESHALGDIQARLGSDAAIVRAAVGELIPVTLRGVVQLVAAVVLMLRIDVRLTGLVLLIVPAAAVVALAFGTRTRRLAREALDCEGEAMAAIESSLAGLSTVQAYGGEARAQDRASRRIAAGLTAARQRDRARAALTLTTVGLTFAGLLLVGYAGGLAVIDGRLSGGHAGRIHPLRPVRGHRGGGAVGPAGRSQCRARRRGTAVCAARCAAGPAAGARYCVAGGRWRRDVRCGALRLPVAS